MEAIISIQLDGTVANRCTRESVLARVQSGEMPPKANKKKQSPSYTPVDHSCASIQHAHSASGTERAMRPDSPVPPSSSGSARRPM